MLPYATHLFTSLGAQNHPILNTPTEAKQIVILGALCVCVCVCVCRVVESTTKIGPALSYGSVCPYFGNTLNLGLYPQLEFILNIVYTEDFFIVLTYHLQDNSLNRASITLHSSVLPRVFLSLHTHPEHESLNHSLSLTLACVMFWWSPYIIGVAYLKLKNDIPSPIASS
jgi:hypothetical protein